MIIFLHFPLYLMETMKCYSLQHGYIVMFMLLAATSKGSACEAPSSPQCFRRTADVSVYLCEWSTNMTGSNVTFDFFFNETRFAGYNENRCEFNEEQLIKYRPVYIWVEAHKGDHSCTSPRRSVVLGHTVKFEAPKNISVSWLKNNLRLSWRALEKRLATAEVWLRQVQHHTGSWMKIVTNTTINTSGYQVTVVNLLKHTSYQVQLRHRSTQAQNPLWSDWSPIISVPAALEHKPEVTITTKRLNGTRNVTLSWKPMPHAAAVRGVTYFLKDTQSSHGCPCVKRKHNYTHEHTTFMYVSYSAVNITVIARNVAGESPPAIVQVPAEPVADLKTCDKMLLENLKKKTCHEWYEHQDGDSKPENVITLTAKKKREQREEIIRNIRDYVHYLYFEHRCEGGKPQTVQMCRFYKKEGVPQRAPQDFIVYSETYSSAQLSWKKIPIVDQQGFLTHYSLCIMKISSKDEPVECYNISALVTEHRLENLTPATKYNISLAGMTRVGKGPNATVTFITLPEKPLNVWLSFGLLFGFLLITTVCTIVLKRIKHKIFPPVPKPVIPDFVPYQAESREIPEEKEEVHDLMLVQPHPEGKSTSEDAEEADVLQREWDDTTGEDIDSTRGDSRMSGRINEESHDSTDQELRSSREEENTDLKNVDNEIALLIYRNGLVFDMKTDSS
ncbi:interleukin-12 receptor subunit beta-1 [Mastacembelus armatus]|uniref:Interleukin 12 receptor subunit beta 1 n=1 Tax=Mastacembelus armatus TaxID=205130 RepID=A0A3Q3RNC1_9TELE|nr:interleukin-12 receptor subunit beta-1 [Mastacembelus armatus]